jgi:hypothetical protein
MTNFLEGRLLEVFGQDYSLSQTVEAAFSWRFSASYSRKLCDINTSTTRQPCAPTTAKRNLGVSDLFLFEPSAFQLRSCIGFSHAYTAMSRMWDQTANCACGQGSDSGHVKQASAWTTAKGYQNSDLYDRTLSERHGVLPPMYAREPSLVVHVRDMWRSLDNCRGSKA